MNTRFDVMDAMADIDEIKETLGDVKYRNIANALMSLHNRQRESERRERREIQSREVLYVENDFDDIPRLLEEFDNRGISQLMLCQLTGRRIRTASAMSWIDTLCDDDKVECQNYIRASVDNLMTCIETKQMFVKHLKNITGWGQVMEGEFLIKTLSSKSKNCKYQVRVLVGAGEGTGKILQQCLPTKFINLGKKMFRSPYVLEWCVRTMWEYFMKETFEEEDVRKFEEARGLLYYSQVEDEDGGNYGWEAFHNLNEGGVLLQPRLLIGNMGARHSQNRNRTYLLSGAYSCHCRYAPHLRIEYLTE